MLILIVCFIDTKLLDTFVAVPFLWKLVAVTGVVGLGFGLWHARRASKGLDPDVTDLGSSREPSLATQPGQNASLPSGQRDYRAAFKPLAEQYHRQRGLVFVVVLGYFIVVFVPFSSWPWVQERIPAWLNYVVLLVPSLTFMKLLVPRLPNCPACGKSIGPPFGPHCPECGGPLKDDGEGRRRYCWDSEKLLRTRRRQRGKSFKYHVCSHCGVMLSDEGL